MPFCMKSSRVPFLQQVPAGGKACRDVIGFDTEDEHIDGTEGQRIGGYRQGNAPLFVVQVVEDALPVQKIGATRVMIKQGQAGVGPLRAAKKDRGKKTTKGAGADQKNMHD